MTQKIIILTFAILFFKIGLSQDYEVEIKNSFWSDTVSNPEIAPIIQLYKNYLESNPDSIYDNPYWNTKEKELYDDFDFSRNSFFRGEGSWTPENLYGHYKPHILKVEKKDSCYLIQSLLYWEDADSLYQLYNPIAITRYYAIKEKDEWKLANALFFDTKDWFLNDTKYIQYHFQNKNLFDDSLAKKAELFCDSLIERFKLDKPAKIHFYIVDGVHEVGQLLGFDHYIWGFAYGKAINNFIISGDFENNCLHELVHQLMPKNENRHWLVDEGVPVWLAGSMGKTYQELSQSYAEEYLENESASFEWALECPINCYPFFAIVIDLIHEQTGDTGIVELMNADTENLTKLYEVIFELTDWTKQVLWEKFDEKIKTIGNDK